MITVPYQRSEGLQAILQLGSYLLFCKSKRRGWKGPLVAFGSMLQPAAGSDIPMPFLNEDGLTYRDSCTLSTLVKKIHRKMDYAEYCRTELTQHSWQCLQQCTGMKQAHQSIKTTEDKKKNSLSISLLRVSFIHFHQWMSLFIDFSNLIFTM